MGYDSLAAKSRQQKYGETQVQNSFVTEHSLADNGNFWTAANPTIGTGIQKAASITAFSDTNALFVIKNVDNSNNASFSRIYLRYIRLLLGGTAPTATVSMEFAFRLSYADRFPTTAANMTVLTPTNVNGDSAYGSIAKVASYANAGAMTIPASGAQDRMVGRARIPTGLGVVGDEYILQFGSTDWASSPATSGSTRTTASAPGRFLGNANPIVIGPGQSLVIHQWWLTAATTVETMEFELGWIER